MDRADGRQRSRPPVDLGPQLAGGEAQRVTNWPGGARTPRFSRDGRSILFVGPIHPGALTEEDNRKAAAERKARRYNVRAYDSFPIRHWDRWLDELRPSLLVQPLDGAAPARDLLAASSLRKERGYGAANGASYGGHLANWLAVTTDRYRALVSHAGLFDLRSQWTTSDSVYSRERNVGGPAWDDLPLWREQSPFYRSAKLRTPILLTYGERDFRVPLKASCAGERRRTAGHRESRRAA